MLFPRIENRKTWLVEVPRVHPASLEYLRKWKALKKLCIEGMWGEDFTGYRFMPGTLFFYVNFTTILLKDERGKGRRLGKPLLTDVGWELAYAMLEARGFSGFMDDTQYSCDSRILGYDKNNLPAQIDPVLLTPEGKLKEYKDPRIYLHQLHSKPLGPPLYHNESKNLIILGARRSGKSFYMSLGELLHEFVFDGAKYYNEETIKAPGKAEIGLAAGDTRYSSATFKMITDCMQQLAINPELGAWGKVGDPDYAPSPFWKRTTGSTAPNNVKSLWRNEYKLRDKRVRGSGSYIRHATYTMENPQALVGGGYSKILNEEIGLIVPLISAHHSNEAAMMVDGTQFGTEVNIGTAGNMAKIEEAQRMFTHPVEYNMLAYPNTHENNPAQLIGLFLPAHYTDHTFKDSNGNTDVEASLANQLRRRKSKDRGTDKRAAEENMLNFPLYPTEMFLRATGNTFPIFEIREQLDHVERNDLHLKNAVPIELTFDEHSPYGIKYRVDVERKLTPLYDYPLANNITSREGAILMYDPPIYEGNQIPPGLYMISVDPFKEDTQGDSLAAVYVMTTLKYMNKYEPCRIVASYIGRPYVGREPVNEIIEKLAMFYNLSPGHLNFENNVGNVMDYFSKKQKLYYLATYPYSSLETSKERINSSASTIVYGYTLQNEKHKAQCAQYTRSWLLTSYGKNTAGNEVRNINKIYDRGLLQELLAYGIDGNYDRVNALFGLVLQMEERFNKHQLVNKQTYADEVTNYFRKQINNLYPEDQQTRITRFKQRQRLSNPQFLEEVKKDYYS